MPLGIAYTRVGWLLFQIVLVRQRTVAALAFSLSAKTGCIM